jgi:hypothetical protein
VPIDKLRRLRKAIVEEDDPETLTRLIAELPNIYARTKLR